MASLPPPAPIGVNIACIKRPAIGSAGIKTRVRVNHFPVKYESTHDAYHYDVAIAKAGEKPQNEASFSKLLCEKLLKVALIEHKSKFKGIVVVCDFRKNLYASRKLPFTSVVLTGVVCPDEKDAPKKTSFDIHVKEASPVCVKMTALDEFMRGRLNYTPYDCIQALDVTLRHTSSNRFVSIGRNFFHNERSVRISNCADIWFGFHQSFRPTQTSFTLNIDTAATAFVRSMPVLQYVSEMLNRRDTPKTLTPRDINQCNSALKGVKVGITHRANIKRSYKVNSVTKESAERLIFTNEEGKKMSVAQFFAKTYKPLRYPGLPCFHVGAVNKNNWLPFEVCFTIEGQRVPKKLDEKQVADMIKVTCLKPAERVKRIEERVRNAQFDTDPNLRAFGLRVHPKMIEADARVLPAANLLYGRKQVETPRGGAWNMKDKAFYDPRGWESMAVISTADRLQESRIANFLDQMQKMMRTLGMKPCSQRPPILFQKRGEPFSHVYLQALKAAKQKFNKDPLVILVIKPTTDAFSYGEIKRTSDTQYGVISQCMLAKHCEKANPQYIANILMKINTKLGGKNTIINGKIPCVSDAPTIVFGADVTHPSPMDKGKPSIAAVVASMDAFAISHAAAIRKQGHRVEQIEDMKSMAISLLKRFYISTKRKPSRIIFYRDGVSEGQFQMVLQYEVNAIREACRTLEKDYCPPITFIVVQKRHHTRLFPTETKHMDRSTNCTAGTIVDTQVCHPHEYDFYLMSHSGIQGTSRPTHYHVLMDENKFKVDDLQSATYKLCYTFARCTRSVSIVPAAYYAHLVAFRARFFLDEGSDHGSVRSGSSGKGPGPESTKMAEVHVRLDRTMYYV